MAFKDTMIWIIESLFTKKPSRFTMSCNPQKRFSDVAGYVRANKMGKSIAGNTKVDSDNGYVFNYEYAFGGGKYYRVRINHKGEAIISMEVEYHVEGAAYTAKDAIKRMEKALPNVEAVPVEEIPVEDYSANTLAELVDVFDKKLNELTKNPSYAALMVLDNVKAAISDKINEKPLAERAPFSKALSNISMYIDALKAQMNDGETKFVSTYAPQIATALAELAALVG